MTEISVGAPVRPNYFDAQGNPGKPFRVRDLDGAIVKTAHDTGSGLTLVFQLADGTEDSLTFSPAVAAGSGSKTLVGQSRTYDAATGRFTITAYRGGTPSEINIGDEIIFIAPTAISGDTLLSFDDGVNSSGDIYDLDGDRVRAGELSPSRLYSVRLLIVNNAPNYQLTLPLSVEQIVPVHTVRRTVTNAELKAINLTAIELIPAPGAGMAIEILSVKKSFAGSDRPTIQDTEPLHTPDTQSISDQGYLYYGYLNPGLPDGINPVPGDGIGDNFLDDLIEGHFRAVDRGHFTGGLYAEGQTFYEVIGRQQLQENRAFNLFYSLGFDTDTNQFWYTDALFDQMMSTANDNTMTVEVDYFIRDF